MNGIYVFAKPGLVKVGLELTRAITSNTSFVLTVSISVRYKAASCHSLCRIVMGLCWPGSLSRAIFSPFSVWDTLPLSCYG